MLGIRNDAINTQNWPVLGIYQPDTIRLYERDGKVFTLTANEGDAGNYEGCSEEFRIGDEQVTLAAEAFPEAEELQAKEKLGRLRFSTAQGYRPTPECVELVTTTGNPSRPLPV
ncbi:MAG: choice-of-anchor I domain-containing protein [Cyanobacteriota bacterium]